MFPAFGFRRLASELGLPALDFGLYCIFSSVLVNIFNKGNAFCAY
jgi:hypothetical protein